MDMKELFIKSIIAAALIAATGAAFADSKEATQEAKDPVATVAGSTDANACTTCNKDEKRSVFNEDADFYKEAKMKAMAVELFGSAQAPTQAPNANH
jgi:hypothetical protein